MSSMRHNFFLQDIQCFRVTRFYGGICISLLPKGLNGTRGNELIVLPSAFLRDIAAMHQGYGDRILLLKGEYDGPAISRAPSISLTR